jgi:hypothetical protein
MILDAEGRPLRRAIGFLPAMRTESEHQVRLVDALGFLIETEETYLPLEECRRKPGPPPVKGRAATFAGGVRRTASA